MDSMMRRTNLAIASAAFMAAFSLPAFAQRSEQINFLPDFGSGQSIAATTTSASITLSANAQNDRELMIVNSGTDLVFCRWGAGAQTAVNTDVPIPSGSVEIFGRLPGTTNVACIAASTTATVRIISGNGSQH